MFFETSVEFRLNYFSASVGLYVDEWSTLHLITMT